MTRQGSTTILITATLLVLVTLYLLDTVPLHLHLHSSHPLQPRQNPLDCTTPLAKDLYGLGVRLGIYFQWTSGWVSNNYIPDEVSGGLDANSIFLFALLISIVNTTANRSLTQVDAFIMLQLCAGTVWSVLSIWGYRTCVYRKEGLDAIRRFGGFGTHLRLLLAAGVSWYSIWFWTMAFKTFPQGLSAFGQQADPRCATVAVFGLPISGPVRDVTLGISVASTVHTFLLTAAAPLAAITRLRKMFIFFRSGHYSASTRLRYGTGASQYQLHRISLIFGTFNLLWILFTMTLIEITLNQNRIYGVIGGSASLSANNLLQPGQLLPMLIGAFSFVRVLFIAFELYRNPDGDISPSLGRKESRRIVSQAQTEGTKPFHVLTMFSSASERRIGGDGEEKQYLTVRGEEDTDPLDPTSQDLRDTQNNNKEVDPFLEFHSKLSVFRRIMVTWLPWLSLLYFWPWTENRGLPVVPGVASSGSVGVGVSGTVGIGAGQGPSMGARRRRYSDYDTEMTNMDTTYNVRSQVSIDEGRVQRPRRMV